MTGKTKTAPVLWNKANTITCTSDGTKDPWGKVTWYDADGNAYELIYARRARAYSFNPLHTMDKK